MSQGQAQFGQRLRVLRQRAQLSGAQLARTLGWAQSKVSRLENGKQTPTKDDVEAWAEAVGATQSTRDDLLADLHAVRFEYASWRRQLRAGNAARQQANLPLEAKADLVRVFTPEMIPGLLQTPDYARHVFARLVTLHRTPSDIDAGVRMRLRRQRILSQPRHGQRFRFLLTEAALRYRIALAEVQRRQLDHLLDVMRLPSVELAVIPFEVVLPVVPSHSFVMFDDWLVLTEIFGAELAFRNPDEAALYDDVFTRLWGVRSTGDEAVELLRAVHASLT